MTAYALVLPLGFAVAFAVAFLVRRAGVLDHPNNRSSHSRPTPRGGGLGVMAALGAASLAWALVGPEIPAVAVALSVTAAAALLGLIDDLIAPGAAEKFLTLMAVALAGAFAAGPVASIDFGFAVLPLPFLIGLAGTALWIFVAINTVNFADGSNGLVALSMAVAGLGLTLVSGQPAGLFLTAALLGFVPWNMPNARLFLGDVGALAIGGWFALAGLGAVTGAGVNVFLVPFLMLPLLVDILMTMLARVRAGYKITQPHRSHGYQILVRLGLAHWKVAAFYAGITGLCVAVALGASFLGGVWPAASFAVMCLGLGLTHARVRAAARAKGLDLGE